MIDFINKSKTVILITDDNPVNVALIEKIVKKDGFYTTTALNGTECIEKTKRINPDLIFLDISMPDMSGIDVCRVLKQEDKLDVSIIFVTANRQKDVLKKAFDVGGTDYIMKPINSTELLSRMKSVLAQKVMVQKLIEKEKFSGVIEMAGAVCHKLNQPLQVVTGYSEMLLNDISEDNPLRAKLKIIQDQTNKMGELTKKLMQITRYETQQYSNNTKIIDIDKAVTR